MIGDEDAVALLRSMLDIPSPSGDEGALASKLVEQLTAWGMPARRDEVGNLVVTNGRKEGPTLVLLSHLDTARGCRSLDVRLEDGRLHGRGAVDAKGPLAAMLCSAVATKDIPARVVVVGAVEEETPGSRGAHHLARTMDCPDALIVGEPSGWNSVVLGYKGQLVLEYTVERPSTHPTNPAEKATEAACAFWNRVRGSLPVGDKAFETATASLVEMSGTMTSARLLIDLRTPPSFDVADYLRTIDGAGEPSRVVSSVPAVSVTQRDRVVRALTAAIRANGGAPRHLRKTGTSDMNTMACYWQVPMATYGPGDSVLDHSDNEHILIEDYLRGIRILRTAIEELGGSLDRELGHL